MEYNDDAIRDFAVPTESSSIVESVNDVGIPDELLLDRLSTTEFGRDLHSTAKTMSTGRTLSSFNKFFRFYSHLQLGGSIKSGPEHFMIVYIKIHESKAPRSSGWRDIKFSVTK